METKVNPDLIRARAQATFDPLTLTYYLYGGRELTERKRYLQRLAAREYVEQGFEDTADMPREGAYEESMRRAVYANTRVVALGMKDQTDQFYYREIFNPGANPFALHYNMFLDGINTQGTPEQIAKWLPLAETYAITATYAQTEMGHGTFLRGLETTAEYDPQNQQFVLNTPSLTASKFWPGGSGKSANVCILNARLLTKGRDCGMQSFLVQLRDLETHQPLPGITLRDIGPKFGYSTTDNGFIILKDVRIPRENMLMRFSKVLPDGTFVAPENERLVYIPMTAFRFIIIQRSARTLAKAATVVTRYSAVRRQSELRSGGGEVQVLDFQTQQHKVFTQIASAYAMLFTAQAASELYTSISAKLDSGNLEDLPVLHALTSGLKAFNTWEMSSGVEQCRMSCGGHGYLMASGLPQMYTDMVSACTYEGDNTVMCLQAARYLNKCQEAALKGEELHPLMRFLQTSGRESRSRLSQTMELDQIIAAFEYRAARATAEANARVRAGLDRGRSQTEALDNAGQLLVKAALAFSHSFTVRAFIERVRGAGFDQNLEAVMTHVAKLFALDKMLTFAGDFRKGDYMNDAQLDLVQQHVLDLLAALRPNAVALVDAFDFPDLLLGSALGRWDGNVYDALLACVNKSTFNRAEVLPAFYKYQKPYVDSLKVRPKL